MNTLYEHLTKDELIDEVISKLQHDFGQGDPNLNYVRQLLSTVGINKLVEYLNTGETKITLATQQMILKEVASQ